MCTSIFLFNEKDRIVFEGSLIPTNELPIVFCICKKKETKNMKKTYSDIDHFTNKINPDFMSDKLDFLSENREYFEEIFKEKVYLYLK
jgi:hypothetical protein